MTASGNTLWAWQVQEPSGSWSMVGAFIPAMHTHSPLIHRNERMVRSWKNLAERHAKRTGQPLRLVRLEVVETLE